MVMTAAMPTDSVLSFIGHRIESAGPGLSKLLAGSALGNQRPLHVAASAARFVDVTENTEEFPLLA